MPRAERLITIRQLLALSYIVVAIPALAFVIAVALSVDRRIDLAQKTSLDGSAFAVATQPNNKWLIDIGRKLRELKVPFSRSPKLRESSTNNLSIALEMSDARGALIYVWLFIFLMGAIVIWWLSIRINRPLTKLNEAILRLARDELVEPVAIQGAKNIIKMSDGLDQLRIRLLENDALKTQFLRHISHEIKTPLTSIKEGSQLLDDEILGPINDEQREIIEILNKSTKELQNSIESLLSYNSAISVNKVKQRRNIDLRNLIEEVVEKQALAVKKKGLQIDLELQAANAFVDVHQTLTVFDNLLSNAIKFSPTDGTIRLWLKRLDDRAEFIIADDGPGIIEKYKAAIFDAFFIGTPPPQKSLKGTGLGLSIARQYVELHNGEIELLTTRKGAAFRVAFID